MSALPIEMSNPYHVPAGRDLDGYIHSKVLKHGETPVCPFYSTDWQDAELLRRRIEMEFGISIISGRSNVPGKSWFARYEIDPGNPTEVLAETYPLAICRLALLRFQRA